MNVYDFDNTIYRGDCTIDFYLYCLRKKPAAILCLPRQLWGVFLHCIHKAGTDRMKEMFFSFLERLDDTDGLVDSFWTEHEKKICPWYLEIKKADDVIVSASPEFLLGPVCTRLGISEPVATRIDKRTGKMTGLNCKGGEKVRRFYEKYPGAVVKRFYSDSETDEPMAEISGEAFMVKAGDVFSWNFSDSIRAKGDKNDG